ncbi:MAG: glycosyltransferase, partial [Elusimicrobia bacterium]|nr:glycosyltransferase [Elusimicrobiota bacterium]
MAVISDFIKEQLVSGGFKEPARIYSAVESKKYKTSCNYNLQNKIIKIGMAGELDLKHKDYLTFIKVAQRIIKDKPFQEIKFYIAGKGKDKDKIKNYIRKKGLENHIKMEGFIDDIRTFYSKLDILLHTARFEGLGSVIIQAMASGLPVVATRTGGIPEIIEDGKNGFLAEKTNERDVAKKLKILIGNPKIREKIGVNGK